MAKKKMNKKTKIILSGAAVLAAGAIANLDGDNVVKAADETKIEKPSTESINKTENKWVVNAQENHKEKLNKEEYSKDTKKLAILEKQKASLEKYANNHPYVQDESQEAIKNINDEIAKADKSQYKTLTEYEKKAIVSKATTDDVYRTTNLKDEDAIDKTYKDLVKKYPNELKGNEKLNYLNSDKTFANPDKEFIKDIIENKVINLKETFPGPGWNNDYYLYKDNLETAKSRFKNYDNMVKTIDDFSNNKINRKTIEVDRDNNEKKLQEAVKQVDKKYKELIRDKVSPEVALYSYYARGNVKIKDEFLKYNVTEKTHTGGDDRKEMVPVFIRQYLSLQKERNANLIKAKNVDYHEMTPEKIKENEKKLNDKYSDPKLMPSVSVLEDFYYNDIMKVQELKEKKDLYNEFLNAIDKGSSPSEIKKFRDKINRTKEATEDDLKVRYRIYNEKAPAVIEMEKKSNDLSKPGKMMRVLLERNVKHKILNEGPAEIEKEKTIEVNRLKKDIASNNLIKNNLEKQFDEKDKQLQKLYQNKGTANELSRTISEMNKIKKSYNDTLIKLNNSIRQISRIDYNNGVKVSPIRDLKIEKKQTSGKYTSTGVNTPKPPVSNSNVAKPVVKNVAKVNKPEAITKDTSDLVVLNFKHRILKEKLKNKEVVSPYLIKATENRIKELEKEMSTKNNSQYSNLTAFEKTYLEQEYYTKNYRADHRKDIEFLVKDMREEAKRNPLLTQLIKDTKYQEILNKPVDKVTYDDFEDILSNGMYTFHYKNEVLNTQSNAFIYTYYLTPRALNSDKAYKDIIKYNEHIDDNMDKKFKQNVLNREKEIKKALPGLIKEANDYYNKSIRPYIKEDLQLEPNGKPGVKAANTFVYSKLKNFNFNENNLEKNRGDLYYLALYGGLLESHNYVNTSFEIRKLNKNQEEYQRLQKQDAQMLQRDLYVFKPKGFPPIENTIKMLEMANKIDQLDQELTIKKHFVELIDKNNKKELVEEYQRMVSSVKYDEKRNLEAEYREAVKIFPTIDNYRKQLIDYNAKIQARLLFHRGNHSANLSNDAKAKYVDSVKKDVDNLNTMKTKLEKDYATKDKELLALYNNKANVDTVNKKISEINSVKKAYAGVVNDMNNKNRTLSRFNEAITPVTSVDMVVRQNTIKPSTNVAKPLPTVNKITNNVTKPTPTVNNVSKPVAKPVVNNNVKPTLTNNTTKPVAKPTIKPVENKVVNRVSKPEAIQKDTYDLIALNLKHKSLKTHLAKGDFGSPYMKKAVENRLKELEKEISTKNNSQYSNLTDFEKRYLERQFVEKNSKEDFKKTVEFLVKDMKEETNKNPLMVKWNERPHAYESILKKPISEITMADFDYITKNYEAVPGVYKNKVLRNYEHKYIGIYYHGMLAYNDYRVQNDLLKYTKDGTKYNTVKSIEDDILKRKSEIEREMKTLIKDVNSYYDKSIRPYVSKDLEVHPNGSKNTYDKESYSYKNAKEHDKRLYNKLRNFYLTEENILDNSFTIHQLATINDLVDKYNFFKDNDEVRALKFNENNYKNYEKYSNDALFKPTGVPSKENIQKLLEKLDVVMGLQHELKTKEEFLSTIKKENNFKNIKIYAKDKNYVQEFYEAIDIMKQLPKYRSQLIDYHAKVESHLYSHRNTLLTSEISNAEKTKYIDSVKKDVDNLNTMKTKLENDYATKDKELLTLYNNKANTDTINKKVSEINSIKKAYTGVVNDMNNKNRTLSRFNESIIPVNSVNMTVRQHVSKPLPVINNTVKPTTVANNTVAKPTVSNVNKSTVSNNTTHRVRPLSRVKRQAVGTYNETDKAVNDAVRKVFGKHQDKNVNHTDSATTVNNVVTAKGEPLVQPALPEYKENNTTPVRKYVRLKREITSENKLSPEKNTDSTTKQENPVISAKGEALVQPALPEYKELTSTVSKEENKPQNKVAALVNEKPEFPLEELEKLKKEQDALNKKEATESKQENKKDNLLDKKDELKDKLTEKKEDIKKESKDLLKELKNENTPKGSDLFDNLANKSSNHSNENTPKIEKKELPKTSSTNSSGLAGIGALGVGLGAVIATRKKKLNR